MHLPAFLNDMTIPQLEYHRRTHEWYREMRSEHPVIFDEDHNVWMVIGYAEERQVRNDYTTFSSAAPHRISGINITSLDTTDPPRHTQLRNLVTQAFSARTITGITADIEKIVNDLLDKALERGHMDWATELAHPLPLIVVSHMLGLPEEDWPHYRDWADALVNERENWAQAAQNIGTVFAKGIEDHQNNPKEDVLGLLLKAEVDGERLEFMDVLSFCGSIFVAGYITTANLLGNAVLSLNQHPEVFGHLRDNPELLTGAVEEMMRYMDPIRGLPIDAKLVQGRYATVDTQLGGQLIRKGDSIILNHLAVNFDDKVFVEPERFDITRSPNRHQTFGHGIHYCLGAPLVRLETKIALKVMLEKMANIQVLQPEKIEQFNSHFSFGPKQLPIVFEPKHSQSHFVLTPAGLPVAGGCPVAHGSSEVAQAGVCPVKHESLGVV
jgi:cytochrome P450